MVASLRRLVRSMICFLIPMMMMGQNDSTIVRENQTRLDVSSTISAIHLAEESVQLMGGTSLCFAVEERLMAVSNGFRMAVYQNDSLIAIRSVFRDDGNEIKFGDERRFISIGSLTYFKKDNGWDEPDPFRENFSFGIDPQFSPPSEAWQISSCTWDESNRWGVFLIKFAPEFAEGYDANLYPVDQPHHRLLLIDRTGLYQPIILDEQPSILGWRQIQVTNGLVLATADFGADMASQSISYWKIPQNRADWQALSEPGQHLKIAGHWLVSPNGKPQNRPKFVVHPRMPWAFVCIGTQKIQVWDMVTMQKISEFSSPSRNFQYIAFHPILPIVATASLWEGLTFFDIQNWEWKVVKSDQIALEHIRALHFSPDGKLYVSTASKEFQLHRYTLKIED